MTESVFVKPVILIPPWREKDLVSQDYEILHFVQNDQAKIVIELIDYYNPELISGSFVSAYGSAQDDREKLCIRRMRAL